MASLNHTHSLRKVRKQKSITFQCNDPKCSWKSPALLIEGKAFKCNYCNNEFIYTPAMQRMRFPHCKDCTGKGKESVIGAILDDKKQEDVLDTLLGGIELD
jgi:hypothetical protein